MLIQNMIYHKINHFRGNNLLYEMIPTRFIWVISVIKIKFIKLIHHLFWR